MSSVERQRKPAVMKTCFSCCKERFIIFLVFFRVNNGFSVSLWCSIPRVIWRRKPIGDKGTNLWNLWWVYYALFHLHQSPLWSDLIFLFPGGVIYAATPLSLVNGIIARSGLRPIWGACGPLIIFFSYYGLGLPGFFAALWAKKMGGKRLWCCFPGGHCNLWIIPLVTSDPPESFFQQPGFFIGFYYIEEYFERKSRRSLFLFSILWISDCIYGLVLWACMWGFIMGFVFAIWMLWNERKTLS